MTDAARVAVALGSNVGDRASHLAFGLDRLRTVLPDLRASRFIDTQPVDVGPQPLFLNAAATGTTHLSPRELLQFMLAVERERGRERPFTGAPRTLDLDLVLYEDSILSEPGLTVPHPRFRDRAFVLEPLAEIAPGLCDPVTGLTVGELWDRLRGG